MMKTKTNVVVFLTFIAAVLSALTSCWRMEEKAAIGDFLTSSSGAKYLAHEVVVRRASDVTKEEFGKALLELGGRVINESSPLYTKLQYMRVELPKSINTDQAISRLQEMGVVQTAERNYIVEIEAVPDDVLYGDLWGMQIIRAAAAWDWTTGSNDIVVAITDTGIDDEHPELADNLWTNPDEVAGNGIDDDGNGYVDDVRGWDWWNEDNDPFDDHGHGTHCSGIVGAKGNNGIGVAGVTWNVRFMPLKFVSGGGWAYLSDAAESLLYAAEKKAHVVNASWGCWQCNTSYIEDGVRALEEAGSLLVASAGNDATDVDANLYYPAAFPHDNVIAVAATTSEDKLAYFSNYGETKIHVAAPGFKVLSTFTGSTYKSLSGTSMAAPHVVGTTALYLGRRPDASYQQVKMRLMGTCDPVSALADKVACDGRINAYKMITAEEDPPAAPQNVVATAGIKSDVTVSWSENTEDDLNMYRVAWGTASGEHTGQTFVPVDQTSIRVRGLENDKQHYFVVFAIDDLGNVSLPSSEQTATPTDSTAPAGVVDLAAELIDGPVVSVKNTVASSEASMVHAAKHAADGSPETAWISMPATEADAEYVVVNFNSTYTIDRVVLAPSAAYPEFFPIDFDLELTTDGSAWTNVDARSGISMSASDRIEMHFPAAQAKALRLVVRRAYQHTSGNYYVGLAEITAYQIADDAGTVRLRFTAPGDDPGEGAAESYDIRYSTSMIDEQSFNGATRADNPAPKEAGIIELIPIEDLTPETNYYFALKATDEAGNTSPLSNIAAIETAIVPPAPIQDLTVTGSAPGAVSLSWTARGDNGDQGRAEGYELRFATQALTPANFEQATLATGLPNPGPSGHQESHMVSGLDIGSHYYFAIRAMDAGGNKGALSNVVSAMAEGETDNTPPATIEDLRAIQSSTDTRITPTILDYSSTASTYSWGPEKMIDGNIETEWMSRQDKVYVPEWVIFDLGGIVPVTRFRMHPDRWGVALADYPSGFEIQVSADGVVWEAVVTVDDLLARFATWDEWTCPMTFARYIRLYVNERGPGACSSSGCYQRAYVDIAEFEIYAATPEFEVDLSWVAPGDDGWIGTAAAYDLRHSASPLSEDNFDQAESLPLDPPALGGTLEFASTAELDWDSLHYFALKAVDESGNWSAISNLATIGASSVPPAPVTDLEVASAGKKSVSLTWTATGKDGLEGTASVYDLRYSTEQITPDSWDFAVPVIDAPIPNPSGTIEAFIVDQLASNTVYFFALKVVDEWSGKSILSNVVVTQTADGTAPQAITDLTATAVDLGSPVPVAMTVSDSSGYYSPATAPTNLIDGSESTIWISPLRQTIQTENVVFDLPSLMRLSRVRILPAAGYQTRFPVDFRFEVRESPQGSWAPVVNESDFESNGDPEEWVIGSVTASQVRLVVTRPAWWDSPYSTSYYTALAEVEVYEDPTDYTTVRLAWTAPGDDGDVGSASAYDLRRANAPIDEEAAFAAASPITSAPTPQPSGYLERLDVAGLESDTTYCFAVKAADELDNKSALSNSPCATTPGVPPATITDLDVDSVTATSATLTWTAPSDDDPSGNASSYELRMSDERINTLNWNLATEIIAPNPGPAGSSETFTVHDLQGITRYYFAVRSIDSSGHVSAISNNTIADTADDIAPHAVEDLFAATDTSMPGTISVTWTAPADVGHWTKVQYYDLRVSPNPIDGGNFQNATQIATGTPTIPDFPETMTISGLAYETTYYVALKSIDGYGNTSEISNVVSATTRDEAPAAITDLAVISATGDSPENATLSVEWTAPGDNANKGTAAAYDVRYFTYTITEFNFYQAIQVSNPPSPSTAGMPQQLTINGLNPGTKYYIAIKTVDSRGNVAALSNVADGTTPDNVAPSGVNDLVASSGTSRGTIILTWTSTGDDGMNGAVAEWDLRYSASPITAGNFAAAAAAPTQPSGGTGGVSKLLPVSGLGDEAEFHFALRARDDAGNWSPVSNGAAARTPDVAPGRVYDLAAVESDLTNITVAWTAPGDNLNIGTAAAYDLRASSQLITESNFGDATEIATSSPAEAGTPESASISGLSPNTTYYVAIKSVDERGNWSEISTILTAKTSDDELPGQITNLSAATGAAAGVIDLTWTAPGDDGQSGRASNYELRHFDAPITTANWSAATSVSGLPLPQNAGSAETFAVAGLAGENVHHFAIRALDEAGNPGAISPSASAETLPIAPAAVNDLSGDATGSDSVELTWTAPGDDGNRGTASSYDLRYSTDPITTLNFDSATQFSSAPQPETAGTTQSVTVTGLDESTTYWFAIKATDDKNATSALSNVFSATTLDVTAPGAPGSLGVTVSLADGARIEPVTAEASSQLGVILGPTNVIDGDENTTWVSSGSEDGTDQILTIDLGAVTEIDRVALKPHQDYKHLFPRNSVVSVSRDRNNWTDVAELEEFKASDASWITLGFVSRPARYVRITSYDPATSFFGLHYTVIAEVEVYEAALTEGSARLTWIAPGDDDNSGTAHQYEVYRHTASFDADTLQAATLLNGAPTPEAAGTMQMMTDSDLAGEQRYYWAARAIDESGNTGPLSTVVTAETQHIAPAPISDLSASDTGMYETTLTWTATGDDGTTGTAASYELKYSSQTLTSGNFADAIEVTNVPEPLTAGNEQSVTVTDLEAGTLYRFAILARDETGAASYLSNVALVSTDPEPDVTPPAAVSDLSAEVPQTGGQPLTGSAVEWSSEQPPDFTAQALLDGSNSTMWSSAARSVSGEESIRFDLGTPTPTDRLKIWPADGYADLFPPAVEIRVSPDGLEWTTVLAESDYVAAPGTPLEATFPVVPARQVEFVARELAREDNGYYYAVAAEIELLTAESEPGTIVVSWAAPGDDGTEGQAAEYDLRIGSCPYDHASATPVTTNDPLPAGETENVRVTNLPKTTYCLGLVATDEAGNSSPLSNVAEVVVEIDGVYCGNGLVDDGEICDDGRNDGSYGSCAPNCLTFGPYCGDSTCSHEETVGNCAGDCDFDLALIVEQSLADGLNAHITQYLADLDSNGFRVELTIWTGGTAADLRALLSSKHTERAAEGAWLVGNLPAAWFEQVAFDDHEEFPCDLYLMDFDSTWADTDADGIFNTHSDLNLDIFTSRTTGSENEIKAYFDKVHSYRTTGSLTDVSAYIFKDDDWAGFGAGSDWGLGAIYETVDINESTATTTRDAYVDKLTGSGAEFVYQWIHSNPDLLAIDGTGGGYIFRDDISSNNFLGSFYNLFDCSAARFTQPNLAMTYAMKTDYGLAMIGSTKIGGIYTPSIFHNRLAAADTWGEAYRRWYNGNGKYNDEWYLGIIVVGDPLLRLVETSPPGGPMAPLTQKQWTPQEIDQLRRTMRDLASGMPLDTFEEYRSSNPDFFSE